MMSVSPGSSLNRSVSICMPKEVLTAPAVSETKRNEYARSSNMLAVSKTDSAASAMAEQPG